MRLCLIAPIPPPYGGIANWTRLISEHIEKKQQDIELNRYRHWKKDDRGEEPLGPRGGQRHKNAGAEATPNP